MVSEAALRTALQQILGFEVSSTNMNQKTNESRTSGLSAEDCAALATAKPSENDVTIYQTTSSPPPERILSLKDGSQEQTARNSLQSDPSTPTLTYGFSSKQTTSAPSYAESVIARGQLESALSGLSGKSSLPTGLQVGGLHYKKMPIQPVEFVHANGIPFIEGCVIKYVCRWRDKGGLEDLRKAKHFLDILIELEEKE